MTPRDITLTSAGALVTDPGVGRGPRGEPVDAAEGVHYVSPEEARGEPPVAAERRLLAGLRDARVPDGRSRRIPATCRRPCSTRTSRRRHHDPPSTTPRCPSRSTPSSSGRWRRCPRERHASPGDFARDLSDALGGRGARPPRPCASRSGRAGPGRCAEHGAECGRSSPRQPPAPRLASRSGPPATARRRRRRNLARPRARRRPPVAAQASRRRARRPARRLREAARERAHARPPGRGRPAPGPASRPRRAGGAGRPHPECRRALDDARRAYTRLAAAATARRGERRAWAAGRAETRRADAALNRELSRSGRLAARREPASPRRCAARRRAGRPPEPPSPSRARAPERPAGRPPRARAADRRARRPG